jgi:glutamate synthase (NADPH/NADH) small chain
LRGLGIADVRMVYRGGEAAMAGYEHEWDAAKEEGVSVMWNAVPVAFEGDDHVDNVVLVRTNEDKRPIPGSEFGVAADIVLLAVGQAKLSDLVAGLQGVAVQGGKIVTDARGATGRKGVWAGGDGRNGGKEVVNAVAEGRDAAVAIHEYLTGGA